MRRHAKAATAGSTKRQAKSLGRFFRGADATRGSSPDSKGSGAPSVRIRLALLGSTVALLALLLAAPVQAAPVTIAEEGPGAGQVYEPLGVAVDQSSGDLYVADRGNVRVDKFDSAGNFLLAWGKGVADNVTEELQTCGPEATPPTVGCFRPQFSVTQRIFPQSVAVDQSSGDVYYSDDIHHSVSKFTPSGQFIYSVGRNVNTTEKANPSATQAEKNICTAASGDTCGNAESGVGQDEFSAVEKPIAVDAAGLVWVGDTNRVVQLDSSGGFVSEAPIPGGGETTALAIDPVSGDFYAISASLVGVRRYTPSGSPVNTLTLTDTLDAGEQPQALGVDGSGNVYVSDCGPVSANHCAKLWSLKVFDPAGEQVSQFGARQVSTSESGSGGPRGNALAVDESSGAPYVANRKDVKRFTLPEPGPLPENPHATDILRTSATLAADLNPEGHETTYHFEYGSSESYGSSTPVETLPGSEFDEEEVTAPIENLLPGTTYHFRLVATNHCNDAQPSEECTVAGEDSTFTTLPVATFDSQWATDVSATAALLNAELGPLGTPGSWWIEYGTTEGYGQLTPQGSLPASSGDVVVQAPIGGLLPGTIYHYRFAVENSFGTIEGPDGTFTTQLSGLGFELTDNRAWEMVSPQSKFAGNIRIGDQSTLQAAADGNGVAYPSIGSLEAGPDGNRSPEEATSLARRGAGGWASKDITPPHTKATRLDGSSEYRLFTPDLAGALLEPYDSTPLSPQASERTIYLRDNTEPATYTPLVTGKEGFANVPPGTVFGAEISGAAPLKTLGANPDLTHVAFVSHQAGLTPGAPTNALYIWSGGQLQLIGRLPAGEGGGIPPVALLGSGSGSVRHAVSEDGSRVFWSVGEANPSLALYARDTEAEESVRLDVAQLGASGTGGVSPSFQGASADGSVVFFTDSQQLTTDASPEGRDLYRCVVSFAAATPGCSSLTDLSAPLAGSGESARVHDMVSAIGEDGTHVYFVADGALDTVANEAGESATSGEPNLYLWQQGEGVRFIATLSDEDHPDWGAKGSLLSYVSRLSAAASPSGRWFTFMSERSLSGYDNREAISGEPVKEIFRYDALADRVQCISCNPTGASPAAQKRPDGNNGISADPRNLWRGQRVAANLPEALAGEGGQEGGSFYRPRAVFDSGRVFFNSFDSLVPADSNGQWDVYEYEPNGVGDCTASSGGASTSRSVGGCVSLISSGTGEEEAAFLDASATGDDAFFITPAQLSVTDEDQEVDVYDARVNGVPATLPANDECLGEACQPPASAPNEQTPASATFKGQGNLRFRPDCGAIARRTGKLSHRARRLRGHAKHTHSPKATKRMRRKAKRLAHRAQALGKQAKRCRRANRRANR